MYSIINVNVFIKSFYHNEKMSLKCSFLEITVRVGGKGWAIRGENALVSHEAVGFVARDGVKIVGMTIPHNLCTFAYG